VSADPQAVVTQAMERARIERVIAEQMRARAPVYAAWAAAQQRDADRLHGEGKHYAAGIHAGLAIHFRRMEQAARLGRQQ
jgi:hypothetical protein